VSAATRNLTLPLTAVRATAAETNEWKCNYSNEDADLPAISQSDKSANVDVVLNDETLCSYDETLARSVSGFYLVIARTRDAIRLASVVVSCPHLQRSYDETLGSYDETLFFFMTKHLSVPWTCLYCCSKGRSCAECSRVSSSFACSVL